MHLHREDSMLHECIASFPGIPHELLYRLQYKDNNIESKRHKVWKDTNDTE